MNLRNRITEDEMIAVFLRAELESERFGDKLRRMIERDGGSLDDPTYARRLLDEHRAYERRDGLFGGFPRDVEWFRAEVTRDELLDILFINWDWWLRVSGGTRRPRDAARRIRAGEIPGTTAEEHEAFVSRPQPELIVAATPELSPLVLMEGHVRLTAYALFPERVPNDLEILVGVSEQMTRWCQF